MQSKFTQKNQSVEKVFQIIEYMAEMRVPLKLQEISKGVGFPSSTALRLMTSLIGYGYIYQDEETLKYDLTIKFCKIGDAVKSTMNITKIIHPYMREISNQTGENVFFAIDQDMSLVYLDVVTGSHSQNQVFQRIGKVAPLHATGIGKILLTDYEESKLLKFIEQKGLAEFTENTLTDIESLKAELEIIRENGYALDNQECELGICCISVPIYDYTGLVIGGISISGPITRINEDRFEEFLAVLHDVASKISNKLGY